MEQKRRRLQVIPISVTNPTAANTIVEANVQLDKGFNRIVKVGYFEIGAGGISGNYNVGVRNSRKTLVDDININAWTSADAGPENKYYDINEQYASGDSLYVRVTPGANTSAAMSGQLVVILEEGLTELPI